MTVHQHLQYPPARRAGEQLNQHVRDTGGVKTIGGVTGTVDLAWVALKMYGHDRLRLGRDVTSILSLFRRERLKRELSEEQY